MSPAAIKNEKSLTPILIIPGICSSAMIVKESPHKSFKGKRIWMNITQLGFGSLHVGGALRKNEKARDSHENASKGKKKNKSSDEMHQRYLEEMECKSRWVNHMCLQSDMKSEKDGIQVRVIPGCDGVDYLTAGALTESVSYVFGPVLKLLKSKGYNDSNLDAAPYDWRLSPDMLQLRDNYFTNTMEQITRLYEESNNTPVLILCHSMGCKNAHYLFNFVLHRLGPNDGQEWLDKYIHSYVPIGAPHLGAPKSVRAVIDGEKMYLDAFLDDDEGLLLGRSMGSTPWLFPIENALSTSNTSFVPPLVMRLESSVILKIPTQTIALKSFVYRRESLPSKLRLAIHLAKDVIVRTDFYPIKRGESPTLTVKEEVWCIAMPPTIEESVKLYPNFTVHLEELGTGKPRKKRRGVNHCDIFWLCRFAFCFMKWILCFPCAILMKVLRLLARGADKGIEVTAGAVGSVRSIGKSGKVNWGKGLIASRKAACNDGGERGDAHCELKFQIHPTDRERQGFWFKIPSSQECFLTVDWKSPSFNGKPFNKVVSKSKSSQKPIFYSVSTGDMLAMEGLTNSIELLRDSYEADPVDPRGLSSEEPPPIKKVVAIYGINVPTEVCGVYERKRCVKLSYSTSKDLCVRQLIVLNKKAKLRNFEGHSIDDGIIRENKGGDGTVPHWSLRHCRTWEGKGVKKCNVTVFEIEGAEHRSILNDKRFHTLLLEILGLDTS